MAVTRYVALLRAINVGGRNPIRMADLAEVFRDAGMDDVTTYINSGNVLFRTDEPAAGLEDHLEAAIDERFDNRITVVVRSLAQLSAAVSSAPDLFRERPDDYYCDVAFLKAPLTPAKALPVVQLRDGVDEAWAGTRALYFARLGTERTKSKIAKLSGTPEYQLMTIRTWSTTTKLLALLDSRPD